MHTYIIHTHVERAMPYGGDTNAFEGVLDTPTIRKCISGVSDTP